MINTTSSSREFTVEHLNIVFSGCLSEFHPLVFQAPIFILLFVTKIDVSSACELLRSKRQPVLSLVAPRAVGEASPGPVEDSPEC